MVPIQPSSPGVVAGLLKSWVILGEFVSEVELVHARCQFTVASIVQLVGPLFEIKNDTTVVHCVSRLELD